MKPENNLSRLINLISKLIICLFAVSCATLFNTDLTTIKVSSVQDSVKVSVGNDSLNYYNTPARLHVSRSKHPLKLNFEKGGITKNVFIPRKLSPTFIYINFLFVPYGHLVDLLNERRFTYPSSVLVDFNSIGNINLKYKLNKDILLNDDNVSLPVIKKNPAGEKGLFGINISIPEGNSFYFRNKHGYSNYNGFLGFAAESYYYYKDNRFASLGAGAVIDFLLPFPVSVHYAGEVESARGNFISLGNGHQYKNICVGYGINFSWNKYSHGFIDRYPDSVFVNADTTFYSVNENRSGFYFSAKYKFTRYFEIGLKYMPSFIDLGNYAGNNYTHILFFDLIFNIESRPSERKIEVNE